MEFKIIPVVTVRWFGIHFNGYFESTFFHFSDKANVYIMPGSDTW